MSVIAPTEVCASWGGPGRAAAPPVSAPKVACTEEVETPTPRPWWAPEGHRRDAVRGAVGAVEAEEVEGAVGEVVEVAAEVGEAEAEVEVDVEVEEAEE